MDYQKDRRREKRLKYNWPVWFAEEMNDLLTQGQMVDISSNGAAFTCYADKCPDPGQSITTRFSVPRYSLESMDAFDLENYIRQARICRVDEISAFVRRVAVQFADPLPFRPGEVTDTEALISSESVTAIGSENQDRQVEEAVS